MRQLRLAVGLIGLAFSVTLAVIIGLRLSDQAMAVIVGVIAGAAASIPTSLIVVTLVTRRLGAADRPDRLADREPEPPRVVVVQSPPASAYPPPFDPGLPAPRAPRPFTVIGGDDE